MTKYNELKASLLTKINKECFCFNFRKISRLLTKCFDSYFDCLGITSPQFNLLISITTLPAGRVTDWAPAFGMDRTTLTRNLKLLEKKGLVKKEKGELPGKKIVKLTSQGIKVIEEAIPMWEKINTYFNQKLGMEKWKNVRMDMELLEKLIEGDSPP